LSGGAALAGAIVVVTHLSLEAARMTGEPAGVLDMSMQKMAWTSTGAVSHAMQVFGLALLVIAGFRRNNGTVLMGFGTLCAIGGFLLVGHTSVHPWRWLLAPLLTIHLLIVAFWFGSLLPLRTVVQREPRQIAYAVLNRFSSLATWLVPLIVVAGLAMTYLISSGAPPIREPYGALIVAKLIGYGVLMILAALNKWRLVPAMVSDMDSRAALRRSMSIECGLIVAILAVTAVMTAFFSPGV
jgi:putative copper resistance protein D